jgi:hypothetical protein
MMRIGRTTARTLQALFLILLVGFGPVVQGQEGAVVECGPNEGVFSLSYAKDYEFSRADWLLLNLTLSSDSRTDDSNATMMMTTTTSNEEQLIARCFGFPDRTCAVPRSTTPSESRYRTSAYATCLPRGEDACYRLVTFGNYYRFPEESEDFIAATFDGDVVVVANRSNHAFATFSFGSGCASASHSASSSSSSTEECAADESLLELFFMYDAPADTLDETSGFRYVDDFTPLPNITFTVQDATRQTRLLERVVTGGNESLALQYMRMCVPTASCLVVQARAPAFSDENTFYNPAYQVKLDGVVFGDQEFDPFTECSRGSLTETIIVGKTAATCNAAQVCEESKALMHLAVAPVSSNVPNTLFRWDYFPSQYFDPDPLLYCWKGENRLYPGLSSTSSVQSFAAFECVPGDDVCLQFALRSEDVLLGSTLSYTLSLDGTVIPSRPHDLADEGGTFDDLVYFENCSSAATRSSMGGRVLLLLWGGALFTATIAAGF